MHKLKNLCPVTGFTEQSRTTHRAGRVALGDIDLVCTQLGGGGVGPMRANASRGSQFCVRTHYGL